MSRFIQKRDGLAMPLVIMILSVLVLLSTAVLGMGSADSNHAANQSNSLQAYYLARSGADAIATYIVRNPDSLTYAQMDARINALTSSGKSSPFKLTSTDVGTIEVEVKKDTVNNKLEVISTGNYQGTVKTTKYLINITNPSDILNKAVFSDGHMEIMGNTINGDVACLGTIYIDYGSINGNVYIAPTATESVVTQVSWKVVKPPIYKLSQEFIYPDFPFPSFPSYPTSLTTITNPWTVTRGNINNNNYFTGGIDVYGGTMQIQRGSTGRTIRASSLKISNTGSIQDIRTGSEKLSIFVDDLFQISGNTSLTINLGDGDVTIRTKRFNMEQGQIKVVKNGNGKLNIYVDEAFQISSGSTINNLGDSRICNIYFAGSKDFYGNSVLDGEAYNNFIQLGGDVKIAANLYFSQAQVYMNGSAGVTGNIISGGRRLFMSGGSYADVKTIYAPNAYVKLDGGASVKGVVVGDTFKLDGGATVTYQPIGAADLEFFKSMIGIKEYSFGVWK